MTDADQAVISHNDIDRLALNVLPILAAMGLETDTWDTIYIAEDLANMVNQFLPSVSDEQTPEDLAFWENVIEGRIHVQLDEESNTDEIEAEAYRLIDLDLASKQVYLIPHPKETQVIHPMAVRMRPTSLDELIGQDHLTVPGSALRRLVEDDASTSIFLWGPPGVGKSTIAHIVAHATSRHFVELSAVNATIKEVRDAIGTAHKELDENDTGTVLFIDEIHRFSKTQQDALLPAVENRIVTLIAATTENPSFSVISPLLSRSILLTLRPLDQTAIDQLITNALVDERGLDNKFLIHQDARADLVRMAGGDARRALTYLEEAASTAKSLQVSGITPEILNQAVDRAVARYDRDGDQHYDIISAFIKSLRGSDPDAALHWLARMIDAGEDPRFIARRLVVHASEDVGMADPMALVIATAAAQAVQLIGLPEARINLAQATIHIATAPKSPSVIAAIDAAQHDVQHGNTGTVPAHLRDAHYPGAKQHGHGIGYRYPHHYPGGTVLQSYAPEGLIHPLDYYHPTNNGHEVNVEIAMLRTRLKQFENEIGVSS